MKLDAYRDDPKTPMSVRAFLEAALARPVGPELPPLFGTVTRRFSGRGVGGQVVVIEAGTRVRVVDAGRFGDVGITAILDDVKHAQARAVLAELTAFSSAMSA